MWDSHQRIILSSVTLFLILQLAYAYQLIVDGRGSHQELLKTVIAQSEPGPIRLWSDHSFRIPTVVRYHQHAISGGMRWEFVADSQESVPDWLLFHSQDSVRDPSEVVTQGEWKAIRVHCERSTPLSGFRWCAFMEELRE